MLDNYFKTRFRNLRKNSTLSFLNIAGLSVGIAVAMLIGLWVWDGGSIDKYHLNHEGITEVMQPRTFNGELITQVNLPISPDKDCTTCKSEFKNETMSLMTESHILAVAENNFVYSFNEMQADAPSLFTLKIVKGIGTGLINLVTILLCESTACALFGDDDPINKIVKFDNEINVKVSGVNEYLLPNTTLNNLEPGKEFGNGITLLFTNMDLSKYEN